MKEIIINGQSLDLIDDEPIALTLQVNNIAELKDRQANYSNEIKVPLTSKNRIILGNPDLAGTQSNKQYRLPFTVFKQNGIIVIPDGVSLVNETEGNMTGLILYSGIMDFFNTIKDKKLSDLDLSDLDHIWDAETAAALNAGGGDDTKCIYPVIQTGAMPKVANGELFDHDNKFWLDSAHTIRAGLFEIQYQVPSVYFKLIIDRIFQEAGYSKEGLVLSDTLYQKTIVACNADLLLPQKFIDDRSSLVGVTYVDYHEVLGFGSSGNWGPWVVPFNNKQEITNYNNRLKTGEVKTGYHDGALSPFNTSDYNYRAVGSYTILIDVQVPVLMNMLSSSATIKISLKKNGVEIGNALKPCSAGGTPTPDYQVLQIQSIKDVCEFGDEYWVTFEVDENSSLAEYEVTVPFAVDGNLTRNNCYFKVSVLSEINIGMKLPVSQILPDMTQSEFIKAWAQQYGIIFQPEALTRTMKCVQFKEIPASEPVDLSAKLDLNKVITIKYRFDDYGQVNNMKYASGEESEKENLGMGSFTIDDTSLERSVDVIELPFQASDSDVVLGDIDTAKVPMWEGDLSIPPEYTKKSVKPRIFAVKTQAAKSLIYSDGENPEFEVYGNQLVAYFNDITQDRNLSFDTDLRDNNYTELIQALDKCKIVRAYFNLTETDVQNLDFFRQVYVEYFNLMFYVNTVEQYIEGRSTLVELVKL